MVAKVSPRVLVVADQLPSSAAGMSTLLARANLRCHVVPMREAVGQVQAADFAAAVIVAPHPYFNGQQTILMKVLDELYNRHVGVVVLTFGADDLAAAARLTQADGLMAVDHTISAEELSGRIIGLLAAKPVVDQLERENAILRKFDQGVNSQMTQLDEEMRLAARLQSDFLPRKLPEVGGCSFDVLFRPATYVSGDIYDATRLDEHHLGFYVADAVGHGMPAALLTIFIKRTLRTKEIAAHGYRIVPPDEALAHLNEELVGQQLSMCQFVTMAYGILDTRTLELQYARAGHPLPLLLTGAGEARELEVDGGLLGVFPGATFPLARVQLAPGDAVLTYSDGFETAFHDAAGIMNDRYRQEFAKLAGGETRGKFRGLEKELDRQEGSLHPRDDFDGGPADGSRAGGAPLMTDWRVPPALRRSAAACVMRGAPAQSRRLTRRSTAPPRNACPAPTPRCRPLLYIVRTIFNNLPPLPFCRLARVSADSIAAASSPVGRLLAPPGYR